MSDVPSDVAPSADAPDGGFDARGSEDARSDSAAVDTGTASDVAIDRGATDVPVDTAAEDEGAMDVVRTDDVGVDAGTSDAAPGDLGGPETGLADVGTPEGGSADVGSPDAGPSCASATVLCATTCVNTLFDARNCGSCGNTCSAGDVCIGGRCGAPRIHTLHPPIADATTGAIQIEGSFGSSASVNFPGVATAIPATVLGPSRIEVSVPAGATAGALTVTTAGVVAANALRFRRTSFSLGLQTFRARYEQTDYARQTPSLRAARVNAASVNTGSWLYLMGGAGVSGTTLGSIERALVNADGTLGGFEDVATGLGLAREGAAVARVGERVYVIGGRQGGTAMRSVEEAAASPSGQLESFTPSGLQLVNARSGHVTEVIGRYVYVFGGDTTSVERALIGSEGALGTFEDAHVTTRLRRQRAAVQVVGGYVYLFGGSDGSTALDTIERAPIDVAHESLGEFEVIGRLSMPRDGAASVVVGNRVYVAGGADGLSVESAEIGAAGALNAFSTVVGRALSIARKGAVSTLVGNFWYLVGGASTAPLATLERAQVNGSGGLGMGQPASGSSLTTGRAVHRLVAIGQNVFAVGGEGTAANTRLPVERAMVGADGLLRPFASISGSETPSASGCTVAVIRNYIYILGGFRSSAITRAVVRADGSLGPWEPSGVALSEQRSVARAVVVGSNLYVMGGAADGGDSNTIDRLPINDDGTLGARETLAARLPTVRYGFGVAAIPSGVVLLGGWITASSSSIARSPIVSGDVLGGFATEDGAMFSGGPRHNFEGQFVGDRLYLLGGFNGGTTAITTAEYAVVGVGGSLGAFAPAPGTSTNVPRGSSASVAVGDFIYVAGGASGTAYVSTVERLQLR